MNEVRCTRKNCKGFARMELWTPSCCGQEECYCDTELVINYICNECAREIKMPEGFPTTQYSLIDWVNTRLYNA